eukprot:GDKI01036424.1.p1 GENE.GDKI01036424.1~~GDKI01036424.1.p1  ORF type:complete len:301 (+),score=43.34 GDKI01036424.1:147-1049(+)
MASSSSSSSGHKRKTDDALKQSVIENLTCLVCYELMASNIFQCPEGHPICAECKVQIKHKRCPTCSNVNLSIRARALESIAANLEVECPYGCSSVMVVPLLKEHKATCARKPLKCSVLNPDCKFTADSSDALVKHLETHHDVPSLAPKSCLFSTGYGHYTNGGDTIDTDLQDLQWLTLHKHEGEWFALCGVREAEDLGVGEFKHCVVHIPSPGDPVHPLTTDVCFFDKELKPRVTCHGVRILDYRTLPSVYFSNHPWTRLTIPVQSEAVLTDRQALMLFGGTGEEKDDLPWNFEIVMRCT